MWITSVSMHLEVSYKGQSPTEAKTQRVLILFLSQTVTGKCKHNETCAKCSETGHKDNTCTKEYKFVNCGETHTSYNKKCSFYFNKSMIFNISEYQIFFSKLKQFIKNLMNRG